MEKRTMTSEKLQMIEKMVTWLEDNYSKYERTYADVGGYVTPDFDIDKMLTDLRNAMETY